MIKIYFDILGDKSDSHRLLINHANEYAGKVQNWQMETGSHGKPFFKDSSVFFNISHSADVFVCAIGDEEVGIDIQEMKEAEYEKIARRFFSEEEAKYVTRHGREGFYDIWVRKEAYVKYTGEGFAGGRWQEFSVIDQDGSLVSTVGKAMLTEISAPENYKCVLCSSIKEGG